MKRGTWNGSLREIATVQLWTFRSQLLSQAAGVDVFWCAGYGMSLSPAPQSVSAPAVLRKDRQSLLLCQKL
jgi:hypothetical protein